VQIIRWPGSPSTVVKIRIQGEVFVAVPMCLPPENALDLARLVLTGHEFDEFAALVHRATDARRPLARSLGPHRIRP
jgi:hypothetical protein